MIVWCTIIVTLMHFRSETAAKGIVLSESKTTYLIDFSKYATEKQYEGDYSHMLINKDNCVEENK